MTIVSKIKKTLAGVALGTVAFLGPCSVYTLDQTEHAVVTSFGSPKRVIVNPDVSRGIRLDTEKLRNNYSKEGVSYEEGAGLKLKFPWQTVIKIDKRVQRWDGFPEEIPTRDKKYLWIDTTARWHVEDPLKYFRTVGGSEIQANAKLSDILDSTTRDAVTRYDLSEMVRTDNRPMEITEKELAESLAAGEIKKGRLVIMQEISDNSRVSCHDYGIRIHDVGVLIKGLTYVQDVKTAVETRMKSERDRIAQKYLSEGKGESEKIMGQKNREVKKIRSEGYKTARDIEGKGDSEAITIYSEGFTNQELDKDGKVVREQAVKGLSRDPEFYAFWRTMMLYESGLGGNKKVSLLIGLDSPLTRSLKGDYAEKMPVKEIVLPSTRPAK